MVHIAYSMVNMPVTNKTISKSGPLMMLLARKPFKKRCIFLRCSAKKVGGVQQKRGKNFLKKMIDVDDRIALIE